MPKVNADAKGPKPSGKSGGSALTPREQMVRGSLIDAFAGSTHKDWTGLALDGNGEPKGDVKPTLSTQDIQPADADVIRDIQTSGRSHGCHECNKKVHQDASIESWEADHIPPKALGDKTLAALAEAWEELGVKGVLDWYFQSGLKWARVLMPACDECQRFQSGLVSKLASETKTDGVKAILESHWKRLIDDWGLSKTNALEALRRMLVDEPKVDQATNTANCIPSLSEGTTPSERSNVNKLGLVVGCHVCGGMVANKIYIADHHPPRELATGYVRNLAKRVNYDRPKLVFRPHCRKCSSRQGGSMSNLIAVLNKLCEEEGIPLTKVEKVMKEGEYSIKRTIGGSRARGLKG